jgi:hypothetical protein
MGKHVASTPNPSTGTGIGARSGASRRRLLGAALAAAISAVALGVAAIPAQAGAGPNTLSANESLTVGQAIVSSDPGHAYTAVMQGDGNFVVYGPTGPIWSSHTNGTAATRATMQSDGNLVLYTATNVPVFATGTNGSGGNRLVMQSDGNLVAYGVGAVWASNNSSERAIDWMYARLGNPSYEGLCEKAVENAFGRSAVYPSARANWNARAQRTPYNTAPRGALVFYNTSANAHVAISLGNGKVITTSAGGRIGIVPISYFQNPVGWAWAPW